MAQGEHPRVGAASRTAKVPVVGVGASAGGLRALQHLVAAAPEGAGLAYVVVIHLDPARESRLAELLQDRTRLRVAQVSERTAVEADHVYVVAPNQYLAMEPGIIGVRPREEGPQNAPVDLLFRTLAEAYGPEAVAVVLSGTGVDGTSGIQQVKEAGGITVVQTPEEAEYDGMPASALATGQVDLVLPAARIPVELSRLVRTPSPLSDGASAPDTEAHLARVFSVLRARAGHDFSLYKRSTIFRRLDRRLGFNGVTALEDYVRLLQASPAEADALVRDLLISVSGFFRDPDAFAALSRAVPALFEGKGPGDAVRVWVVGCATGEEAYSIAILLNEHAATLAEPPQVQIFATDIDPQGYARGRAALYPAAAVADISPERLRRYFTQEPGGYRVQRSLREGVLFAVHNVLRDPPFSRLDLVSCRNLLIYLQPEAQKQVVDTFHYALRSGGLLFLGRAETVAADGPFQPVSESNRIYRRDSAPRRAPPRVSAADLVPARGAAQPAGAGSPAGFAFGSVHLHMLEAYAPPSLIVNEELEIVHLSGRAGRFLHLPEGAPTHGLLDLARGDLRMELRAGLYQAFQKGLPTTRGVRLDDGKGSVRLRVLPPVEGETSGRFALVTFEEVPEDGDAPPQGAEDGDTRLEEELRRTREQAEEASVAHGRTVEELQDANEELISINEEQKAAAQELETSREEIQSINEELITINQEHQGTIEELKRTNADLQNLIESTGIGTLFLDREMRIRRYTPAAAALFHFVPGDLGRPLLHITHLLDYPGLMDDVRGVLASLGRTEREVRSASGEWYIARISPYRSLEGGIDGAVLTLIDHSAQKRVEEELREAKGAAEAANQAKGVLLATLSHEFRTPLTGMLACADILGAKGPLTPPQEETVAHIRSAGRHLAAMIDEVLAFAILGEGQATVHPVRIDARETAREAAALVEAQAAAKGLAFHFDLPAEPVVVHTDAGKARQVLANLCGNAVKYTERGEVRIQLRTEGHEAVFEVRDTGIGIAPEHHERIFERFWQVDSTSARGFGGMGIGLAAAREYARLLGGEVEVESDLGRGSTFRFRMPLWLGEEDP